MKFVRRLPDQPSQRASERDPFCFEPYTPGMENILPNRKWSSSLDTETRRYDSRDRHHLMSDLMSGHQPGMPVVAWSPNTAPGDHASETESVESRESAKSRDTSPSHSPLVPMKTFPNYQAEVRQ